MIFGQTGLNFTNNNSTSTSECGNTIIKKSSMSDRAGWVLGCNLNSFVGCGYFTDDVWYCSECRRKAYEDREDGQQLFDYCPYCGKRMRY